MNGAPSFQNHNDPSLQDWIGQPDTGNFAEPGSAGRNAIDMPFLRGFLFRQYKIIGAIVSITLLLGLLGTLLASPVFEAETTVRVDPEGNTIVQTQDVSPTVSNSQIYQYRETLGEVIESRRLASKVVEIAGLHENDAFIEGLLDDTSTVPQTSTQPATKRKELAATKLQENVEADIPFENRIVAIRYRGPDPELAALISNTYAQAFILNDTERRLEANTYALNYLTEQIEDVRVQLQDAEIEANDYARRNRIVGTGSTPTTSFDFTRSNTSTITADSLARINVSYIESRAERLESEQRWLAIQDAPPMQILEVQQSATIQELQSEASRTSATLADLRERYADSFPQIAELVARLGEIERQIETTGNDIKEGLRNQYLISLQQERALEQELQRLSGETLGEQDRRIQYELLDRKAGALRLQLAAMLARFNDISAAENVQPGSITLLDPALVPERPISPNLLKNLALALIIGFGLAGLVAILREVLDDRLRSLEDVEEKFGIPLLGHTPFLSEDDITNEESRPFGALIESYASVVSTLDYMIPFHGQALLLTSSQPSEGKTTTARVIAEKYAELGRKTLLIDADLRRPTIAREYGFESGQKGLIETVLGHCSLADALLPLGRENLDVLPMGKTPPNPVEFLSSEAFAQFVASLRDDYSRIIFDASPVMGIADAPLLSRHVDGTIFIAEANRVHYGQAKASLRRLRAIGAKLTGVILTKYRALEAGQPQGYEYRYYDYSAE